MRFKQQKGIKKIPGPVTSESILVAGAFLLHLPHAVAVMNSGEVFNWSDADVTLRCTHDTESRDFRVHKLFLSFASPVFRDMFEVTQPSSPASNIVNLGDPPQALELILRFIYPSSGPPAINDLTIVSQALSLADKYDIEVARSRLRSSLVDLAATEPLRVYAIACRFGLEDEMKIAASRVTLTDLLVLTQLPDEFKLIPATDYHHLIRSRIGYRKKIVDTTTSGKTLYIIFGFLFFFWYICH